MPLSKQEATAGILLVSHKLQEFLERIQTLAANLQQSACFTHPCNKAKPQEGSLARCLSSFRTFCGLTLRLLLPRFPVLPLPALAAPCQPPHDVVLELQGTFPIPERLQLPWREPVQVSDAVLGVGGGEGKRTAGVLPSEAVVRTSRAVECPGKGTGK